MENSAEAFGYKVIKTGFSAMSGVFIGFVLFELVTWFDDQRLIRQQAKRAGK